MCGEKIKKALCVILSVSALLLSGCGKNGGEMPVSPVSESGMSADASSATESTEGTSLSEVSGEKPETPQETEETAETSVSSGTEETSSVTESVSSGSESFTAEVSNGGAESKNTETVSETEIASEIGTETAETSVVSISEKAPETAAPKAEIVIPEVKIPLANGTQILTGENAEVDYGNAADGYISAVYSGSSAQAKLRVKCGDVQYDHDLKAGGKREFFPLMGSGKYTVKMYEQVSGKNYAEILSGDFEASVKSETATYLYPNKYVNYGSGSECVKKAAEVCAGKNGDVERIGAIFDYISDNISYDKGLAATVKSGYIPDPDSTLAAGKGICFDYASLFAAMCRSQSIPTRLVIGYAEPNIYHAWNEVYTDETGWITPELFLKKKGYNIADATFYAGNSDKEKIADYISDDGNYSAMYRY